MQQQAARLCGRLWLVLLLLVTVSCQQTAEPKASAQRSQKDPETNTAEVEPAGIGAALAKPASPELSEEERRQHLDSFDYVWKTIHIRHFGNVSIHSRAEKLNSNSTGLLQDKLARGKRGNPLMMVFYPPFYFLRVFVVERQFLNGWAGFITSALSAWYVFLKYSKLYEHFQFEEHGADLLPADAPEVDRDKFRKPA